MYRTEQEKFWAGKFGDEYVDRNKDESIIAGNLMFFTDVLRKVYNINSFIEFGSNIGMNIHAITKLRPGIEISAIEINKKAVGILKETLGYKIKNIYNESILDFKPDYKRDFVYIKGVLTHINPDEFQNVYQKLYDSSNKYIMIAEYYNLTPEMVEYRGHSDRIFRRDFAGEMLDKFPDLELVDYKFYYHRDKNILPSEDAHWFLLKKREA